MKPRWVKFYDSSSMQFSTLYLHEMVWQAHSGYHQFADAKEAQEKSTEEVVIFWDGQLIGRGLLKE